MSPEHFEQPEGGLKLVDENILGVMNLPELDLHAGKSTCLLKFLSCLNPTKSFLDLAVFFTQNMANFHSCGPFELLAVLPAQSSLKKACASNSKSGPQGSEPTRPLVWRLFCFCPYTTSPSDLCVRKVEF